MHVILPALWQGAVGLGPRHTAAAYGSDRQGLSIDAQHISQVALACILPSLLSTKTAVSRLQALHCYALQTLQAVCPQRLAPLPAWPTTHHPHRPQLGTSLARTLTRPFWPGEHTHAATRPWVRKHTAIQGKKAHTLHTCMEHTLTGRIY